MPFIYKKFLMIVKLFDYQRMRFATQRFISYSAQTSFNIHRANKAVTDALSSKALLGFAKLQLSACCMPQRAALQLHAVDDKRILILSAPILFHALNLIGMPTVTALPLACGSGNAHLCSQLRKT